MFIRIRIALGIALTMILATFLPVFAKGGFSFISITGPGLKAEVRSTDLALTEDFFAFADFYKDRATAPADPGAGYEITRYYIDGKREIPFDHFHYYPETGFVYYDGIAGGGWSEYDGKWYTAKTEVKTTFESALSAGWMSQIQSGASTSSTAQTQPNISLPPLYLVALIALGIAFILSFAYRLRKPFSR